ncbi:MAG: SPOR domain-containing protein [Halomonas sp.]|uniref:SPOR domain-containing protein n=1 Tax=Halomonas sp. TaxID=1486246 RepID=UPI003F9149E4
MAKKPTNQKPAPRKRGATSARKARKAKSHPRFPGWFWLLIGLIGGFLASQHQHGSAPWQDDKPMATVIPPAAAPDNAGGDQAQKGSEKKTPTFEFYTLLPETEVIVPDGEVLTSTATPPPRPTSDKPDSQGVSGNDPIAQIIAANTTTRPEPISEPTPEPKPEPKPEAKPEPKPEPIREVAEQKPPQQRAPANDGNRYMLQAASFSSRGDASELSQSLANFGLQTKISEVRTDDGSTWYRVQSGPYNDRREIDRAKDLMATRGITPLLIQLQ